MTVYEKNANGKSGRAAMQAIRAEKSARAAMPPEFQGLLPNVPGDEENKVPKDLQSVDNEIIITLPILNPPSPPMTPVELQLLRNGIPVGEPKDLVTPLNATETLILPSVYTSGEGPFQLSYELKVVNDVTPGIPSVQILVDKTAPNRNGKGAPIQLPVEYADLRITKERLEANPEVILTIPLHPDRRTGDIANVYMGASFPAAFVDSYVAPDDSSSAMTVRLSKQQVENGREGPRIIYYQWIDRVGNEGPRASAELNVNVELTSAPANLKPIEVPEAEAPGHLITLQDAYPTVGAVIKPYDNVGPLDYVIVEWDGIPQPRKYVVDEGFPIICEIPFEHVKRNGLGPRDVDVRYSVFRGDQEYPELTQVLVNVDLRRAGTVPPDPENPEVGNGNLAQVSVQAAVTTEPNKFELIDAGQDGTAKTLIDLVREIGDVYQLMWGGVPVPGARYVVDGTELDDQEIEFIIPHQFITDQGNDPEKKVHYQITNPSFPDENPNSSLRQLVSVYVVEVTLPTPVINFTEIKSGIEFLTCSSLRNIAGQGHVAVITVPGGSPLEDQMDLNFIWDGFTWDGTMYVPLPSYPFSRKLSNNEHISGFTVYLPYTAALLPIKDAKGNIRYEAKIGGRTESSDMHEVRVIARDGAGVACRIP